MANMTNDIVIKRETAAVKRNMLKALFALIAVLAIFLTQCREDLSNVERLNIVYAEQNHLDHRKDKTQIATITDDADFAVVLKALKGMKRADAGNCGFGAIEIIAYTRRGNHHYFVGGDECQRIQFANHETGRQFRIENEDYLPFKSVIDKYLPDRSFMPWMREWARIPGANVE